MRLSQDKPPEKMLIWDHRRNREEISMERRTTRRLILLALCLVTVLSQVSPMVAQDTDVTKLVTGNTQFAFRLYGAVRNNQTGNVIVAPYSISQAFGLVELGTRNTTQQQIATVFGFGLPDTALHPAMNSLNTDLIARGNH